MTQNIYDDPTFFAGYSRLPRSIEGLDAMPEWPAMRSFLPALEGCRVLDLGCGFGWFCRWARGQGAASVLGVDLSERMLERARAETPDGAVAYAREDLERFVPAPARFDLAYSALAFHYIADLRRLLAGIHGALVPGGRLVFSIEHPIFTAPMRAGWSTVDGRPSWPLDSYLDEGPRTTDWLAPGVVKQHRTIGTHVALLVGAGFRLRHLVEWGPSDAQVAAHPEWADERQRPPFLLVACERPAAET